MIDLQTIALTAFINAISGLIQNIFYIILAIWGVKTLVKQVPKWIGQYEQIRERQRRIDFARGLK